MRKRRILSLLLAVAVMATMLVAVPLTASAATWPVENIYTIGKSGKILADTYYDEFGGKEFSGTSHDRLIGAYKTNFNGTKITVDGTQYNHAFNVKGIANRSFAIKVKTGCVVTIYGPTNNGQMAVISPDSNTVNKDALPSIQKEETEKGYYTSTYTYDGDSEQVLYISSCNSAGNTNDARISYIDIKYTKPLVDIGYNVYLLNNTTETLNVTTENMGDSAQTITWENSNSGNVELSDQSDTSATVKAIGEVGTESKITAKCTYNAQTYEASCVVKVVDDHKDVVIKGCDGVKSITLTKQDEPGTSYTANWERTTIDNSPVSIANNDQLGTENKDYPYKQKQDGNNNSTFSETSERAYLRTIQNVEVGTYDITYTYVDEYYEDNNNSKTLKVSLDSEYSSQSPAITLSTKAKNISDGEIKGTYAALDGKTIEWDFTKTDGNYNNYISRQNNDPTFIYSNTTKDVYMLLETKDMNGKGSHGKFASSQSGDNIQINQGTTLTVPVVKDSNVTVTTASDDATIIDFVDTEAETYSNKTFTYKAEATGSVKIKCGKSDYIKTITIKTDPLKIFGEEHETDSGYYTTSGDEASQESDKIGVIRFFQSFADNTEVTEYGFYFVNGENGQINEIFKSKQDGPIQYETYEGMYADFMNIQYTEFGTDFWAKPYVIISGETEPIFGKAFSGKVNDDPKWVVKPE